MRSDGLDPWRWVKVLSRNETIIWRRLEQMEADLGVLEQKVLFLEALLKRRLKEEADERNQNLAL